MNVAGQLKARIQWNVCDNLTVKRRLEKMSPKDALKSRSYNLLVLRGNIMNIRGQENKLNYLFPITVRNGHK